VFALLFVSASASAAPPSLEPLLNSIAERLAIADQVALSKWDSHKPVEDKKREQEVIASVVAQAPSYKLDPAAAGQFFSAQIEANKLVQYAHLSDWQFQGKAPDDPRPGPGQADSPATGPTCKNALLQQLADFSPQRTDPQCPQWLAEAVHEPLNEPMQQLAMIRATRRAVYLQRLNGTPDPKMRERAIPLPHLICVNSRLPEQSSQNRTILVREPAPFPPTQPILVRNYPMKLAETPTVSSLKPLFQGLNASFREPWFGFFAFSLYQRVPQARALLQKEVLMTISDALHRLLLDNPDHPRPSCSMTTCALST
jgi:chorismate mutase